MSKRSRENAYRPAFVPCLLILLIGLTSVAVPVYATSSSVQNDSTSGISTRAVSVATSLSLTQYANGTGQALKLGWLPENVPAGARVASVQTAALPAHFDWRSNSGSNWMTSVKNQGGCGSCVAFAAVGATEGQFRVQANNPSWNLDLSEQHLFSCGGGTCSGGWYISSALNYLQQYGTPDESCSPYQGGSGSCSNSCPDWQSRAFKISSWSWVANNVGAVEAALMNGPLVAGFTVYSDFYYGYNGGVYHWDHVSQAVGGHAVVIVGYDAPGQYWIVKNSWGMSWGENGYFRIGFGEAYIENYVASIKVSASPPPPPPNQPPTASILSPDKLSPQVVGSTIVWTASASDPDGDQMQYRFWTRLNGGSWTIARDWSTSNTWSWTPAAAGSWDIAFHVRDGKHQGPTGWDDHKEAFGYVIQSPPPNNPPQVSSLMPDKASSSQVVSSTIVWTCSASDPDGDAISYRFFVQPPGGSWSMIRDWSTVNTWAWTPAAGTFNVACHVRDGKHAGVTGWDDHKEFMGYVVLSAPPPPVNNAPKISSLTPDKASPQVVGSASVTWTCSATDAEGDPILYRFFVQSSGGSWSMVQDWSGTNALSWTPTIAGTYNIACHVRDGKHAGVTGWDDHKEFMGYNVLRGPTVSLSPISGAPGSAVVVSGSGFTLADSTCLISSSPSGLFASSTCTVSAGIVTGSFTVTTGVASGAYSVAVMGSTGDVGSVVFTVTNVPPTISSLSPDKSSPQQVGTLIAWTCSASDPNGESILYRFFVQPAGGSWSMIRDWSTVNTWAWTPAAGTFNVACHVRDGKHAGVSGWDDHKEYMGYSILRGPTVTLSPTSGPVVAVVAVTGSGFAVSDSGCTISSTPSGLFSSSTCTASAGVVSGSFTVAIGASGLYTVTVTGVPAGDAASVSFTVTNGPPVISSLTPDKASGTQLAGSTIVWTCSATDAENDAILYRFFVQSSGGSWSMVQDWSASSTWSWTPSAAGTFNVACHVRDGKHAGVTGWDDHKEFMGYSVLAVLPNSPPAISGLTPDKASPQVIGTAVTWTCSATDAEGDTIQYRFWTRLNGGAWTVARDWSPSNTWSWTSGVAGTWDIACHVRDGKHQGPSGWDDHKEAYSYSVVLGTITGSWMSGLVTMYGERSHDIGGPSEIAQTSESLSNSRIDLQAARGL